MPEGIYVKRDFRWYEVLSRLMLEVVRDLSPRVEYYSIDEFFFLARPPRGKSFQELAEAIRDRILGAGQGAGDGRHRPDPDPGQADLRRGQAVRGLAVLDVEAEADLLADRPVTEITGIAGRRAARLMPWGIRTCLDLARADRRLVRSLLTASGEALWWELNGDPVQPIQPQRPAHKVLSRGGSLGEATADPIVLYAWLVRNLERLIEELEYHEVRAGRLTVWVAYKNGHVGVGQTSLAAPSDRFDLLLDAARPCLRRAWIPRVPANRMHLIAERLTPRTGPPWACSSPPASAPRPSPG